MQNLTTSNLAANQLEILMATSQDAIISKTTEGIITGWNPAAEQLYGYTAQEVIGQSLTIIIPPNRADEFPYIMERLQRSEPLQRYETQRCHKDGRLIDVSLTISALKDPRGEVVGALSIAHDITREKQALELLQQREEAFRLLAEAIPQLVWTTRPDGYIDYFNQGWFDYTGLSLEESQGWGWERILHPDDLQPVLECWQRALQTGSNYEVEYRLKRAADGSYRWHIGRAVPLRDASGAILKWFGTCTDIDDSRCAQALTRESEARFHLIAEAASDLICMITAEGTIEYVSPAYRQVLGYAPETLVHQPYMELLHPEDHSPFLAARDAGHALQYRMRRADGSWVWVEGNWYTLLWQERPYIAGIAHDITQRKEIERRDEELHRSGERFKRLVDANIIGVLVSDEDGVVEVNDVFLKLVGYSREEFEHKRMNWAQLTPAEEMPSSLHAVEELRSRGICAPFEKEYLRKDGRRVPVLIAAARLQEEPFQWMAFVLDLTAQKELERRKSELITIASHELRTPLTSIKGYLEVLLANEGQSLSPSQRAYLDIVQRNTLRLIALINDLLDLSRLEAGTVQLQRSVLDLNGLMQEVVQRLHLQLEAKQQHLTVSLLPSVPVVLGDPDRILQVLTNLLSNAHKFTPQGGKIELFMQQEQETIHIGVRDSGIGMTAEEQAHLFTKFYRAHPFVKEDEGTGMGLAITRALVEMHAGTIKVESAPGEGSTFHFTLPIVREATVSARRPSSSGGKQKRILIVEDEPDHASLLRYFLEQQDYEVLTTYRGNAAISVATQAQPDLIILDVALPESNGMGILQELKHEETTAPIPVLLLTMTDTREEAILLGAMDVLEKPFSQAQLQQQVSAIVRGEQQPLVLVAASDPVWRTLLYQGVEQAGYRVMEASNANTLLQLTENQHPQLVLLDVDLLLTEVIDLFRRLLQRFADLHSTLLLLGSIPDALYERWNVLLADGLVQTIGKAASMQDVVAMITQKLARGGSQHADAHCR